jgi:hypothetical protein
MEAESSLSRKQQPATYSYPEPDQSNPRPLPYLLSSHFNIIITCPLRSCNWYLSLRLHRQNCTHHSIKYFVLIGYNADLLQLYVTWHTRHHQSRQKEWQNTGTSNKVIRFCTGNV